MFNQITDTMIFLEKLLPINSRLFTYKKPEYFNGVSSNPTVNTLE